MPTGLELAREGEFKNLLSYLYGKPVYGETTDGVGTLR
jgi:hypothetical protein